MAAAPRYPAVVVRLSSVDGNAYAIMGATRQELRRAGVTADEVSAYVAEARAGDYDHLLQTTQHWVTVE